MKIQYLAVLIIYLLGVIYLALPSPSYPDLSSSARSEEPGDTWQHPDQKGYYSNLTRQQVLSELQSKFTLKFMSLVIPSYRLNYRPEEAFSLVRDQLQSYYLEEIIYPLRESLFVNGWEPKKSPKFANSPLPPNTDLSWRGVPYDAKITLRPVNSSVWSRLLIWSLIFPATYLVFNSYKKILTPDGQD